MIWFQPVTLEELNRRGNKTLAEHLGIRFTAMTDDSLTATMPVDRRTQQPLGLLHGGASVALAETVASTAANLCVDPAKHVCVGLEINANHIRSKSAGLITAIGSALHLGKSTQVWQIRIIDEQGELICISRLTMAILARKKAKN